MVLDLLRPDQADIFVRCVTVEYVVLAILAFPWSYSVLGMAGGIITTMIVAVTTLYTSLILWKYCLRHPQIR